MIKKIVITDFDSKGQLQLRTTLTTKQGINVKDYKSAKKEISSMLKSFVLQKKYFSVEWEREGCPEGYFVGLKR